MRTGWMRQLLQASRGGRRASAVAVRSADIEAALAHLDAPGAPWEPERGTELLLKPKWSVQALSNGHAANSASLASMWREFNQSSAGSPEEAAASALDLCAACLKLYELDDADALLTRVFPVCRAATGPYLWKVLQLGAALRYKQRRYEECARLLEELCASSPPNPATQNNLAVAYAALQQWDKAEAALERCKMLKGSSSDKDDQWTLGVIRRGQGNLPDSAGLLERSLREHRDDCPDDPVIVARVQMALAETLMQAEQYALAEPELRQAHSSLCVALGSESIPAAEAARLLATALIRDGKAARHEILPLLQSALRVECSSEGIHPTPLYDILEEVLSFHTQADADEGPRLAWTHPHCRAAVENMDRRGLATDGHGGAVLHKIAEMYLLADTKYAADALPLLRRADSLISAEQQAGEDLGELLEVIRMETEVAEKAVSSGGVQPAAAGAAAAAAPAFGQAEHVQAAEPPPVSSFEAAETGGGEAEVAAVRGLRAEIDQLRRENAVLAAENQSLASKLRQFRTAWVSTEAAVRGLQEEVK
eukprot:TRINITY_DN32768_c0_g1_i1.p1 TRINITY_DN32768_c0_g1~~TRINITY_DN32768_c0_g1_i1.p1  ORF type:complete len:558 (+),score=223.52 TRINITY_DN32768_c0_g1_i1:59-1675(+)